MSATLKWIYGICDRSRKKCNQIPKIPLKYKDECCIFVHMYVFVLTSVYILLLCPTGSFVIDSFMANNSSAVFFSITMFTYLELYKCRLVDGGYDARLFLNYHQWRTSWYSFIRLLNIDMESGIECPLCGQYPRIIVCDATSLSFRRELLSLPLQSSSDVCNHIQNGR